MLLNCARVTKINFRNRKRVFWVYMCVCGWNGIDRFKFGSKLCTTEFCSHVPIVYCKFTTFSTHTTPRHPLYHHLRPLTFISFAIPPFNYEFILFSMYVCVCVSVVFTGSKLKIGLPHPLSRNLMCQLFHILLPLLGKASIHNTRTQVEWNGMENTKSMTQTFQQTNQFHSNSFIRLPKLV